MTLLKYVLFTPPNFLIFEIRGFVCPPSKFYKRNVFYNIWQSYETERFLICSSNNFLSIEKWVKCTSLSFHLSGVFSCSTFFWPSSVCICIHMNIFYYVMKLSWFVKKLTKACVWGCWKFFNINTECTDI